MFSNMARTEIALIPEEIIYQLAEIFQRIKENLSETSLSEIWRLTVAKSQMAKHVFEEHKVRL